MVQINFISQVVAKITDFYRLGLPKLICCCFLYFFVDGALVFGIYFSVGPGKDEGKDQ
jgi:hypothetical protein